MNPPMDVAKIVLGEFVRNIDVYVVASQEKPDKEVETSVVKLRTKYNNDYKKNATQD